ncbi:hypothetical protein HK097_005897 [Rhizophlyctis rosea]|uniref:Uncharacterized protein n=1 Tax=Rhizophlyctis rosea TaxID=64517 RepID=A0AAD5SGD2_9FUNG|nr:hypothetical protein HK097_005897 [Rhizophlyctis rosea]
MFPRDLKLQQRPLTPVTPVPVSYRPRPPIPEDIAKAYYADLNASVNAGIRFGLTYDPTKTAIDVRRLAWSAVNMVVERGDAGWTDAQRLLDLVLGVQDMSYGPRRGYFPWTIGPASNYAKDDNSVEFTTLPLMLLWATYGQQMPAKYAEKFKPALMAAVQAVVNRNVTVSYTNIYLLSTASLLIAGHRLDPKFLSSGLKRINNFVNFAQNFGISEYTSPEYMAVDLGALYGAYHFGPPDATSSVIQALDLLWDHSALNFFPSRGSISGPHARDYEFQLGVARDVFFHRQAFFQTAQFNYGVGNDQSFAFYIKFNDDHPATRFDPLEITVSRAFETKDHGVSAWGIEGRAVMSRAWLDQSVYSIGYRYTYNYVSGGYALGTSSTPESAAQELNVRLELTGCRSVLSVIVERYDRPYGDILIPGADDKLKPTTQRPGVVTVQDRGTAVGLWNMSASAEQDGAKVLATDVLIPLDLDELWIDNVAINLDAPVSVASKIGGTVRFRKGLVCGAVKVLHATGCDSLSTTGVQVAYKPDEGGANPLSSRLVIYHTQTLPKSKNAYIPSPACDARAMLAISVKRCNAVGGISGIGKIMDAAKINRNVFTSAAKQWEVDITVNGMRAEIGWGLALKGGRILWRRANGRNYTEKVADQAVWVGKYYENGSLVGY